MHYKYHWQLFYPRLKRLKLPHSREKYSGAFWRNTCTQTKRQEGPKFPLTRGDYSYRHCYNPAPWTLPISEEVHADWFSACFLPCRAENLCNVACSAPDWLKRSFLFCFYLAMARQSTMLQSFFFSSVKTPLFQFTLHFTGILVNYRKGRRWAFSKSRRKGILVRLEVPLVLTGAHNTIWYSCKIR